KSPFAEQPAQLNAGCKTNPSDLAPEQWGAMLQCWRRWEEWAIAMPKGEQFMAVLMSPYGCAGRSCDGVFQAEEGSPLGRSFMKLVTLILLLPGMALAWPDPKHPFKPSHVLSSYDENAASDQIWKWFFDHLAESGFKMPKSGESFYFDSYLKEVTVRDFE